MNQCCIEGCATSSDKNVFFFDFPTSRLARKRWLAALGGGALAGALAGALRPRLCSRHFAPHEYEHVRGRTRLRGKVLPTLRLCASQPPKQPKDPLAAASAAEKKVPHDSADEEQINDGKHNGDIDVGDCSALETDGGKPSSPSRENGHHTNHIEKKDNIANTEKVDNDSTEVNKEDKDEADKHKEDKDKEDKDEEGKDEDDKDKEDKDEEGKDKEDKDEEGKDKAEKDKEDKNKEGKDKEDKEDKDKAGKKRVAKNKSKVSANKKVKKKWVPLRPRPRSNGHVSDDSSSQGSVHSEVTSQPILEDLEEHLPNYQIANMKTERQVAAMTDTVDPIEELMNPLEEAEELTVEPHIPVFIELSVGQDSSANPDQVSDCLMVMESVQCDVDPTLMLEARAEDDECCEQIDLDDEDDDDVLAVITNTETDKTPKRPVDPISLLTSSDEDDVILQEPHIDTLSVSDETDEDDLPLQKLIKREKKAKKKKKKKEPIKSVLVCAPDFYCTYCGHVSACSSTHHKHLKTHSDQSQATTRVYQICKECGFTTSSKTQLSRHQRKHVNERRFKCPLCSYRSKYNMSLMYHLKTHKCDPNMYNCGACGLELDSKKALLDHQNTCYEMSEKFLCGVCGFVAGTKRALKSHRNAVHNHKV